MPLSPRMSHKLCSFYRGDILSTYSLTTITNYVSALPQLRNSPVQVPRTQKSNWRVGMWVWFELRFYGIASFEWSNGWLETENSREFHTKYTGVKICAKLTVVSIFLINLYWCMQKRSTYNTEVVPGLCNIM